MEQQPKPTHFYQEKVATTTTLKQKKIHLNKPTHLL